MATRQERRRAEVRARRARRQRRPRSNRRRVVAVVVVAALAIGAGGFVTIRRSGDDGSQPLATLDRRGSVAVDGRPSVDAATGDERPTAYRIVYRVESPAPGAVTYRTDIVSVRRPWESRLDTLSGRPPGDERLSSQVATFGQRVNTAEDQEPSVLTLGPVLPASDLRLGPVIAPALEAGILERREVRRVAGRDCQVYRSADYLSTAALRAPTEDLYADSCVDGDGLLLEEVLVSGGEAIARRIAVEVDTSPTFDDDTFPVDVPNVPAESGGGSMRRLVEGSRAPGTFFEIDAVPAGFEHRGRYSVVPPQAENFGSDLEREGFRRAVIADVFIWGIDVLVVEQGSTLRGTAPFEADPANPTVDAGPHFGAAEVRLSALGNQVRARFGPGGRFVQATGTLAPDELAAVLRSLREVPGGELQFADG